MSVLALESAEPQIDLATLATNIQPTKELNNDVGAVVINLRRHCLAAAVEGGDAEMKKLVRFTGWSVDEAVAKVKTISERREPLEQKKSALRLRVKNLVDQEDPESFTPHWIRMRDKELSRNIYDLRCEDELFSWHEFINGIGKEYLFKFDFKAAELGDLGERVAIVLERDGIESWDISWLFEKQRNLYATIVAFFNKRRSTANWHRFLAYAPSLVRERFDPDAYESLNAAKQLDLDREATEKECVEAVTSFLLGKRFEEWSPRTIQKETSLKLVYDKILALYACEKGLGTRWALFIDKLPKPLSDKFARRKFFKDLFEEYPEEQALYIDGAWRRLGKEVKTILEREDPDEFNSGWIEAQDYGLCSRLRALGKYDEQFFWYRFIDSLGDEWIERFYCPFKEKPTANMTESAKEAYYEERDLYIDNMPKVLQARLRKKLEEKKPNAISTGWIDDNCSDVRYQTKKLVKIDEEFSWYEFIKGVGEEWVPKFKLRSKTLRDFASMWAVILKRDGLTSWHFKMIRREYPVFASSICGYFNKHLSKGIDWQEFFDTLPDDAQKSYDAHADSEQAIVDKREQTFNSFLTATAKEVEELLVNHDLMDEWTVGDVRRLNADLLRKINIGIRRGQFKAQGISSLFPYLSREALDGFTSKSNRAPYMCLAERVMRYLGDKFPHGWNLTCIKDDILKRKLKNLGVKILILVRYMRPEYQQSYEYERETSQNNSSSAEERIYVETILEQTGYLSGKGVSFKLFDRLIKLHTNRNNQHAWNMAVSILHEFFEKNNPGVDISNLDLSQFFESLRDGGDFEMQLIRIAHRMLKK